MTLFTIFNQSGVFFLQAHIDNLPIISTISRKLSFFSFVNIKFKMEDVNKYYHFLHGFIHDDTGTII